MPEPGFRHPINRRSGPLLLALLSLLLSPLAGADATARFLAQHWQRPVPPQGAAPAHYSQLEASLDPDDCGSCHPKQRQDWGDSLHSRAMGPGLMGQLIDMPAHARDEHQSCIRCHAPLAEQADALAAEIAGAASAAGLHRRGVVCAACHVRQQHRFGPPRRDGSAPAPDQPLPHNGWQASDAFADSRFCASCHQFEPGDFALNGKLLENTYNEWLESPYAAQQITCQRCHMPDRQHRWKGIHDRDTVRAGVTLSAKLDGAPAPEVRATLTLSNSATGHRFPTYVTPQVVLEGYQAGADGEPIAGTEAYFVVARRIALDLSEEIFDTRLAPGEAATLDYNHPRAPDASTLVLRVWVQPDFFYEQFYQSLLDSGQTQRGRRDLSRALTTARGSVYTLYERRLPLN